MQSEVEVALTSANTRVITSAALRSQRQRGEAEAGVMKKYTKLVLALVAVVSSLAFIIYKYRYDRLYHVMQVN